MKLFPTLLDLKNKNEKPEDFSKWMRKVGYLAKCIYPFTRLFLSFGQPVNQTVNFLPYRQLSLEISWPMLLVSSFQWWQWPDYSNAKIEILAEYFSSVNEHSNIHRFSQGQAIVYPAELFASASLCLDNINYPV